MIETFVKRPAMTIVFILVFVVLGLFSYKSLIIEATPRIEYPIVSVNMPYPGATPVEVETQLLKKIEDAVAEISDIKKINGNAYESFGLLMIEFEIEADVNNKAIEVKDKVEAILNELPDAAERPIISKFDPLVTPIFYLTLSSDKLGGRDLYQMADDKVKPLLSTVPGVASVDISGGLERQININLNRNLMQRYFVTLTDISSAIKKRNLNVPGGSITQGQNEVTVRFQGEFQTVKDIREMPLVTKEGISIKLSDVATIVDGAEDVETISRWNGKGSVTLAINKLSDGDAISIAKRARTEIERIAGTLPEGTKLEVASDSTTRIIANTNNTLVNIAVGVVLTVIILFMFLGNFRVTFIAAVVIPTSIISSFLLMDIAKFSINMMTLLAVGTALGTLIANAIVIIESVVSRLEQGLESHEAAIQGTKDVALAVLASAGTNLVVFTPIAFMGGMVGQFMNQFGLTVVFATIFSVIGSFTLTPMMCGALLNRKMVEHDSHKDDGPVRRFLNRVLVRPVDATLAFLLTEYKKIFNVLFKIPKTSLVVIFMIIASPMFIMPYIGGEFFSTSDEDIVRITVEMPQGSALSETQNAVGKIEDYLDEVPEVESFLSIVGEDGYENASVIVNLEDLEKRNRSDVDIINLLTPQFAKIPDASITMARGAGGGASGQADVTIDVRGVEYENMVELSKKMESIMKDSGFFRSITSTHKDPKDEIVFLPNSQTLQRFGVSNSEVGPLIRTAVTGDDVAVFRERGEEFDINVTIADEFKRNIDDISSLYIDTKGGLLPISRLGNLEVQKALPPLKRRDKRRIIQLSGYLSKSSANEVQAFLAEKFKGIDFEEGYDYAFTGRAESMAETGQEIATAFLMAVILTYMLLVAILNSFIHPFTIVSAVFTSFVGVFYFLFFMEFTINIGSMMAFVMLVGLAVNNAILLLDQTMVHRQNGKGIQDALWLASEERFRPIAMTSLAVIAGTLPQLFDNDGVKASMGAVVVGGMIASMFFTFVLIPLVYNYLEKMIGFFKKDKTEQVDDVQQVEQAQTV
ncbi:MAG: efflux RND transporter permease subunit [Bacteriovoracaceae bacterium]|nr:efflux RND transporter permease subunit [Bacteriovoracaceae bacterium]